MSLFDTIFKTLGLTGEKLLHDLTTKKKQELKEKMEKSRSELLSIFDGMDDPMVVINKNFRIQRVNQAMREALGKKSYKEFIGRACYFKLHGYHEKCPGCSAPKTFHSGKKTARIGLLEKKSNPDETTYQITCYPLKDSTGKVTSIVESYRDITDTIHMEEELYQSERNRLVESLAAGVAHEVRNPLAVIQSTAQYCLGEIGQNKELEESLQAIIKSSQVANNVVSTLLDFSKPSEINFKQQSIKPLLKQALQLVKGRAKSQKVKIVQSFSKTFPKLTLDEKQINQALINFFINALDAMPKGGILRVEGSYHPRIKKCVISIKDTGQGVPEEMVPKIFHSFYSTKKGGIGLGLPIAEGIIRSHGGKVSFKSWEGRGSEVKIELPFKRRQLATGLSHFL